MIRFKQAGHNPSTDNVKILRGHIFYIPRGKNTLVHDCLGQPDQKRSVRVQQQGGGTASLQNRMDGTDIIGWGSLVFPNPNAGKADGGILKGTA